MSVAGRDTVAQMRAFVRRHGLEGLFPHVADPAGRVWARFGVTGQPAWVFVDDGGATSVEYGALSPDRLRARLDELAAS